MTKRQILCGSVLLAGIVLAAPARGQTALTPARPMQNPPQTTVRAGPPSAAVRRPPRLVDAPSASDNPVEPSRESDALDDEALNRKISGICRGC